MRSSRAASVLLRHTRQNIDVVIFSAVFAFLIVDSFNYHEVTRQFPLTFLALGLIFLVMEFSIDLLPEGYARTLRKITSGLTEDIQDEFTEQSEEVEEPESTADVNRNAAFAKILALLFTLLALTYAVGFLFAALIFVYLATFTVGTRKLRHATIMALLMAVLIYGVFGELFNVPIFEGMFDITDYVRWL